MQSQKKRRDESRVLDIIRKSMLHQNVNLGHADWKLQLWAKCLCVCVSVRVCICRDTLLGERDASEKWSPDSVFEEFIVKMVFSAS